MPAQKLRPYQESGVQRVFDAWRGGAQEVLLVMPTGSGKTSLFGAICTGVVRSQKRCLVVVHRRELATQAANRFTEFGVDFGYVMAGLPSKPYAPLQIGSVQTLVRRDKPKADLVIFDEAHLSTAKSWQAVREAYPHARVLGVTATPWRLSGKPLVGSYGACVVVVTPRELRELGFLSPYVGFSYKAPDLSGVKTTGGDYNEKQSAEAMSAGVIVDNIVEEWIKHANTLSTVVFAVTVAHSRQLTEKFKAAGVAAEHLDGTTPLEQRKAILKRVETGVTRVLCNVGVAVEGLDIPRLKCCVLARPTKSLARAIQMMGRVRRPWEGVTARIHDHAFVIRGPDGKSGHGLPDDDRDFTLNAKAEKPPPLTTCEVCLAIYTGTSCPSCSHENEVQPSAERVLQTVEGAEQFTFESGVEEELRKSEEDFLSPPVEVRWTKPARVVEGRLLKRGSEKTDYGTRQIYLLQGPRRQYRLPGTTHLDMLMRPIRLGADIRVTYLNEAAIGGGKFKKLFKVEVDNGA